MSSEPENPAFPYVVPEDWKELCHGITVREYFAAHAPAPPDWFAPVVPKQPEPIYGVSDAPGGRLQTLESVKQQQAWDRNYLMQQVAQWPWAWADAVLAAADTNKEPKA